MKYILYFNKAFTVYWWCELLLCIVTGTLITPEVIWQRYKTSVEIQSKLNSNTTITCSSFQQRSLDLTIKRRWRLLRPQLSFLSPHIFHNATENYLWYNLTQIELSKETLSHCGASSATNSLFKQSGSGELMVDLLGMKSKNIRFDAVFCDHR